MNKQITHRLQFVLLAIIAAIFLLGASHSTFAQNNLGKKYGSRDPHTCADNTLPKPGAPSPASCYGDGQPFLIDFAATSSRQKRSNLIKLRLRESGEKAPLHYLHFE